MDPKLYEAARNGDSSHLLNMAQQDQMNLHSQLTPNQNTVLHVATEFKQFEFVKAVTEVSPSLLLLANSSGDTALHVAARDGLGDIVQFFVHFAKTQVVDIEDRRGREQLFRMVNVDNDTALHCAARLGHYVSMESLLKADPEVCSFVNNADESPLYLAVASGFWDLPPLILDLAPSSASYKGANGLTALHPTLYFFNYEIDKIELLVKWRREMIRQGDSLGLTPLHYAALYGRTEALKLFLQYDSTAIYKLDENGESAMHIAAFRGHIEAVEEIINCRPDSCYLTDNRGRTVLHSAVLGDQRNVIKIILGSPKLQRLENKADNDGNTPLHLAALFKLYAVIEILVKDRKSVNLHIKNKELLTALDVYNKHDAEGLRAAVARSLLKGSSGTMAMQRLADEQTKKMNREAVMEKASTSEGAAEPENGKSEISDYGKQSALEVNLLVATLVATVTFAAGFTMPGGIVNDGEDEGLAVFANKAAFQVFVVFNNIAFCTSVFAVLLQFHTSIADYKQRVRYMGIAAAFTTVAILAMVIAFATGSFVVLRKSNRISISPYVICGCFAILYFLIPFCDPGVEGFPCLSGPQKFVRSIIIRCVRYEE